MYWPEGNHAFNNNSMVTNVNPNNCEFGRCLLAGNITSGTGAHQAANTAVFVPVQITEHYLAKTMFVANGAVAGNIDVGIYDRYGTRLVSSGSTAMSGASAPQVFNITDTMLNPGTYFIAFVVSTTTTATFTRVAPAALLARACGVQVQTSALPLPSTATFANPGSGTMPIFGMSSHAVI